MSKDWVYERLKALVPHVKIGGALKFRKEDLDRYKPKAVKKGKKAKATTKTRVDKKAGKRTPALASLEVAPKELVVTYKGAEHKATVNTDGTITVNDKTFNSPSRAGKEITGREVDGWTFWRYEIPGAGLKKLNTLRQ